MADDQRGLGRWAVRGLVHGADPVREKQEAAATTTTTRPPLTEPGG